MPWSLRVRPVPIVAWICAVEVGEEPTVASSNHVPLGISDFRYGHAFGMRLQDVHAARRPTPWSRSAWASCAVAGQERLGHRLAVGGVEAIELQQFGGRGSHIGGRDRPVHLALGRDVARGRTRASARVWM